MDRKKVIALVKLVEDNMPGVVDACFKEPFLADKHLLWEQIMLFCIKHNIKGEKFNKFISNCCANKMSKIIITKAVIEEGMYSDNLINLNLSLNKPVPFIDETRSIYVSSSEGNKVNSIQKALFKARLFNEKHLESNNEVYAISNKKVR